MNEFSKDIESTIQLYLRNELSQEQAEAFEDFFVDKGDVLEKIEHSRKMMHGLKLISMPSVEAFEGGETVTPKVGVRAETQSKTPKLQAIEPNAESGRLSRVFGWLASPVPAYACAVLAISWVITTNVQTSPSFQPQLIGFSTAKTRSAASSEVVVDLSGGLQGRAIFLKLPSVDYREYRLQVSNADSGESVWLSEPFTISALRDRLVMLPDELSLSNASLEVLAERDGKEPLAVNFCHYSEVCR